MSNSESHEGGGIPESPQVTFTYFFSRTDDPALSRANTEFLDQIGRVATAQQARVDKHSQLFETPHVDEFESSFEQSRRYQSDKRYLVAPSGFEALVSTLVTFAGPVVGSAAFAIFLRSSKDIIVQWIKSHSERSVTVKIGSTEIKITGRDDVETAIAGVMKLIDQQGASPARKVARIRAKPKSK